MIITSRTLRWAVNAARIKSKLGDSIVQCLKRDRFASLLVGNNKIDQ